MNAKEAAIKARAIIPLLEMFSDNHSMLQGAAGEDALSVGDLLPILRAFAATLPDSAAPAQEPT